MLIIGTLAAVTEIAPLCSLLRTDFRTISTFVLLGLTYIIMILPKKLNVSRVQFSVAAPAVRNSISVDIRTCTSV